jgi:hypothetical protein
MTSPHRCGVALAELLLVLVFLVMLFSLVLPALQLAREATASTPSPNNLSSLPEPEQPQTGQAAQRQRGSWRSVSFSPGSSGGDAGPICRGQRGGKYSPHRVEDQEDRWYRLVMSPPRH